MQQLLQCPLCQKTFIKYCCQVLPLHINSLILGGGHTHTHTHDVDKSKIYKVAS